MHDDYKETREGIAEIIGGVRAIRFPLKFLKINIGIIIVRI